jgi:PAS domain S-box-containing protein
MMNLKTGFPSFLFLRSIFVVVIFLLIFISGITYKHIIALNTASHWVLSSDKIETAFFFTPRLTLYLLLFCLLVFIVAYFQISKDFAVLKNSNEALMISTELIRHAEEIGEFSTWEWNSVSNRLIYSDNQYRLLGYAPQSFEPTLEHFSTLVHPEDRHIIVEGTELVLNGEKVPPAFFRIIRADGELRYFKALIKELKDADGKRMLIGVNSDVTEQHLNSLIFEEKNRNLEARNQELASFNHIASHDLQEPLRKIQTFISRIPKQELANLSPTSQGYFLKIQASAEKMRAFIDDLLLFSRANKIEKAFELTDLTVLLDNAKQELAEVIAEKNAVIKSGLLPELTVIPFQIQQLFINLISNSLKYSSPNRPPLILINCEIINVKETPSVKMTTNNKCYKISIIDNGIGFEQQYAEKIFNLFHRLHARDTYFGTGIGLAICKKIIENHSGIITAQGVPDVGATFTVFLPI